MTAPEVIAKLRAAQDAIDDLNTDELTASETHALREAAHPLGRALDATLRVLRTTRVMDVAEWVGGDEPQISQRVEWFNG